MIFAMTAGLVLTLVLPCTELLADEEAQHPLDYGRWKNGLRDDPGYFPIAVWLQAPKNAEQYRKAGINVYVGLWKGPTEAQLRELKQAGMSVICAQNETGLNSQFADTIVGWMHGDEPDNAQARRDGAGYGPPISPEKIIADYERMRARDPSRPILLNLGQGVAFDDYIGRGVRRNHPEDYPEYIKGCDIASFDIYPVVHRNPKIAGKLEFVARGVERLRTWSGGKKIVWNCIECSRISNTDVKPTPAQIRSEVWMSLIHGSRGLIYFVHQFEPRFIEASLLQDSELLSAITAINQQIHSLAPVLNSPTIEGLAVTTAGEDPEIALLSKRHAGAVYVFAVNMTARPARATFRLLEDSRAEMVQVLGEERTLAIEDNGFQDKFAGYAVHLYRVR